MHMHEVYFLLNFTGKISFVIFTITADLTAFLHKQHKLFFSTIDIDRFLCRHGQFIFALYIRIREIFV